MRTRAPGIQLFCTQVTKMKHPISIAFGDLVIKKFDSNQKTMDIGKRKRSRELYLKAVHVFVITQSQYCNLLQSFLDEWIEGEVRESHNPLIRDSSTLLQALKKFCLEAKENLNAVQANDDNVTKIRVSTLFNMHVVTNRKFKEAVACLLLQEEKRRLGDELEKKLVDIALTSLVRLRKNLARINQVMVDANEFEAHETTMALIRLNRLLDAPLALPEEPSSYDALASAFGVSVDRAHDISLVSQRAGVRRESDEAQPAKATLCAVQRRVGQLKTAISDIQRAVEHAVSENLRFAEMWYEVLGHNAYEYAVRSFLDQCQHQQQKSVETSYKLVRLQQVLGDTEVALAQALAGTGKVARRLQYSVARGAQNVAEGHGNSIGEPRVEQALELVAVVVQVLVGAMHDMFQSIAGGRARPMTVGHRDIVVEYYRSIMFTDVLCLTDGKTKVLFETALAMEQYLQ